ncbi:MAG: outer membrane protein assembly factor BamD [Candidatus Riflebacteria bacterium]|nr:outer membrane protein assembly factor BamD [Candidatus Riflebacteria bacterium]
MCERGIFLAVVLCWLLPFVLGCGNKEKVPTAGPDSDVLSSVARNSKHPGRTPSDVSLAHTAFPWQLEGKDGPGGTPLGKAGATTGKRLAQAPGEEFNRRYETGLKYMENEKFGDAMQVFDDIVKSFPGSDEASMAEYRMAQIHFRNKSNNLAIETYKRIVEQYPSSPIAENARAALTYMETFEMHEKNYISPDVEDRKRRGR